MAPPPSTQVGALRRRRCLPRTGPQRGDRVPAVSDDVRVTTRSDRPAAATVRRFPGDHFDAGDLVRHKRDRRISVCIPARDEAATLGGIVRSIARALTADGGGVPLVDEIVVVDDGSRDGTGAIARAAGARVVGGPQPAGGKGQAMRAALKAAGGDVIAFLDADVTNFGPHFVTGLLGPLLVDDALALVKGFYDRPLLGVPGGGGRVTELVARPLIDLLFPHLAERRAAAGRRDRRARAGCSRSATSPTATRSSSPCWWTSPPGSGPRRSPRSTSGSASTATVPSPSCAHRPPTSCRAALARDPARQAAPAPASGGHADRLGHPDRLASGGTDRTLDGPR